MAEGRGNFLTRLASRKQKKGATVSFGGTSARYPEPEPVEDVRIEVFPYTYDPTIAWELLKTRQTVRSMKPMKNDTPIKDDYVRFVAMSCTHGKHRKMTLTIPDGDVLLVCGDFTTCGHPKEIHDFNMWLGHLPHRYKVLISGNHELTFDPNTQKSNYMGLEKIFKLGDKTSNTANNAKLRRSISRALEEEGLLDVRQLLTSCIYLEDCVVEIYGIKIYGTPWQPAVDNWAFNLPRGQPCLDKWNLIPQCVDVLMTHTPPLGYGDLSTTGFRSGCVELMHSVRKRIRPKFHVFGHIHEGYGMTTDGYTKFVNSCTCDSNMRPSNQPIIFDLPVPPGVVK